MSRKRQLSKRPAPSFNVSVAGALVMYDRLMKQETRQ